VFPAALAQTQSASALIFAGRGLYRGFSMADTNSVGACLLTVYDAASSADTAKVIDCISNSSGQTVRDGPFNNGVAVERGLFITLSAAVRTTIFYNTETRLGDSFAVFADGTHDITALSLARLLAREAGE
jgi:hypothetical protein